MLRDPRLGAARELPLDRFDRLLLFGGTFDPPTLAHVELPERVRLALSFDAVLYVPARVSPFKTQEAPPAPAAHRVGMLQSALKDRDTAMILLDEVETPGEGPSYTIDTLREVRRHVRDDAALRLLIGTDQATKFSQWKSSEAIESLAEPVVMLRPPRTRASMLDAFPEDQRSKWRRRVVDVPRIDASATEARRRLAAGERVDDLADILPPPIRRYIEAHDLYRPSPGPPPRGG